MSLRNDDGSALPLALFFSVFAVIAAMVYLHGQYAAAVSALSAPASLQALCNARAGIWKALETHSRPSPPDTLSKINTLDSLFNSPVLVAKADTTDSGPVRMLPNAGPQVIQPYCSDSFGNCSVSLSDAGCLQVLDSKGHFRKSSGEVVAALGGELGFSADTVCYLVQNLPTRGVISGACRTGIADTDKSVSEADLKNLFGRYRGALMKSDTLLPGLPLLVQSNDGFGNVPDIVNGPLVIDGTRSDLLWKQKRRLCVLGDLQITGRTIIQNVNFIVLGEIKVYDDSRLLNVSFFSPSRILMGDQVVFSGTAMTQSNLIVYGHASVEQKSILFAMGEKDSIADSSSIKLPAPKPGVQHYAYAIEISDYATIDAVVVSFKEAEGIKIEKNAAVKGILWTKGSAAVDGTMQGVVRAKNLVDGSQDASGQQAAQPMSVVAGSIRPLPDLAGYFGPFFIGKSVIIKWQES